MSLANYLYADSPDGELAHTLAELAMGNTKQVARFIAHMEDFVLSCSEFHDQIYPLARGDLKAPQEPCIEIFHVPPRIFIRRTGMLSALVVVDHECRTFSIGHLFNPDKCLPEKEEFDKLVQYLVSERLVLRSAAQ